MFDLLGGLTPEQYREAVTRTSLLMWWPAILDNAVELSQRHDVLLPRTMIIKLPDDIRGGLYSLLGEGGPEPSAESLRSLRAELKATAEKYGVPLFLRTDHTSNKHSWKRTCFVTNADEIWGHFQELVCFSLCMMPELPVDALVIREYIKLAAQFIAFDEMPIAPEVRIMVRDGIAEEAFPYWPEEAFENHPGSPANWRELLISVNAEAMLHEPQLRRAAEYVGSILPGYWSVDFALAENAGWYLIDMADGRLSWKPENESQ